jgi:CRP-like cAMP-binding protein
MVRATPLSRQLRLYGWHWRMMLVLPEPGDGEGLQPDLETVELEVRKVLESPNKPIKHSYFIERGLASIVAGNSHKRLEVGLIGSEGMTGLPIVLGNDRSPHENFIQVAGEGLRLRLVEGTRKAIESQNRAARPNAPAQCRLYRRCRRSEVKFAARLQQLVGSAQDRRPATLAIYREDTAPTSQAPQRPHGGFPVRQRLLLPRPPRRAWWSPPAHRRWRKHRAGWSQAIGSVG